MKVRKKIVENIYTGCQCPLLIYCIEKDTITVRNVTDAFPPQDHMCVDEFPVCRTTKALFRRQVLAKFICCKIFKNSYNNFKKFSKILNYILQNIQKFIPSKKIFITSTVSYNKTLDKYPKNLLTK